MGKRLQEDFLEDGEIWPEGRDGQGWPPGTPSEPKPEKVRRQRKKFEDAREVLVGSTQDEDVGALVEHWEAGGEGGQVRAGTAQQSPCSEMIRSRSGGSVQRQASTFRQSPGMMLLSTRMGAQVPGYRLNKGLAGMLQCPSIPSPLEPQVVSSSEKGTLSPTHTLCRVVKGQGECFAS